MYVKQNKDMFAWKQKDDSELAELANLLTKNTFMIQKT